MRPSAQMVAQARWGVRVALRLALFAALLMAAWAAYREVGAWRASARAFERARAAGQVVVGPSLLASIAIGWRWLMIAALLLAADLFALRLLVPMPRRGCPGCGYDVDESKQNRCPECGLELGAGAGRKETGAEDSV